VTKISITLQFKSQQPVYFNMSMGKLILLTRSICLLFPVLLRVRGWVGLRMCMRRVCLVVGTSQWSVSRLVSEELQATRVRLQSVSCCTTQQCVLSVHTSPPGRTTSRNATRTSTRLRRRLLFQWYAWYSRYVCQGGCVFMGVSFSVCLLAGLCENYCTNCRKLWWKSGTGAMEETVRFWW